MCSESFPKEFEKTTEVLPFSKYGLTSIQEYKEAERDVRQLEWLKKAGLTYEEINLFKENEAGLTSQRKNIESNVMKEKLHSIYSKINRLVNEVDRTDEDVQPSTSSDTLERNLDKSQHFKSPTFYPEGHPMNNIKDIEHNLFAHLKNDDMMPINKRRKVLRRLERKKDRILALEDQIDIGSAPNVGDVARPGSLWDVKELSRKQPRKSSEVKSVIGPKQPTMYTVKNNKIVRLEPVNQENNEEYRAIDIVMPVNNAEAELLEGTKMCIDDIKKIERFKDYEPGIPSKLGHTSSVQFSVQPVANKVNHPNAGSAPEDWHLHGKIKNTLYLKNIAPSVTLEQLSLLFNQFMLANGGPIDVRLLSGRMRGQAFVAFQTKDIAIQALEETNGTILSGRPVIAQFGRNTNRILDDNR